MKINNLLAQLVDPIGRIKPIVPVAGINSTTGQLTGIIALVNTALRVIFIIAGLYALFNIVLAGLEFINAGGDPKKVANAWSKIWQSFLGLLIIVSAFLIAAIFGIILFGDPSKLLNPRLDVVR